MAKDKDCEHESFHADVAVARMEDTVPMAFMAEIRISCAQCSKRFRFVGVDGGLDFTAPRVSIDATELNAPIEPEDEPRMIGGPVIFRVPKMKDGIDG